MFLLQIAYNILNDSDAVESESTVSQLESLSGVSSILYTVLEIFNTSYNYSLFLIVILFLFSFFSVCFSMTNVLMFAQCVFLPWFAVAKVD